MNPIRVEAIPTAVAERIRADRADGHGNTGLQPIHVDEHPGYICRHCLEDPALGESVYLVSYSPFDRALPYRTVGPIFVHTTGCRRYDRPGELPKSLHHRLLSLRAYRKDDFLAKADVVAGKDVDASLDTLFQDPMVAYVRHPQRPPRLLQLQGSPGTLMAWVTGVRVPRGHCGAAVR